MPLHVSASLRDKPGWTTPSRRRRIVERDLRFMRERARRTIALLKAVRGGQHHAGHDRRGTGAFAAHSAGLVISWARPMITTAQSAWSGRWALSTPVCPTKPVAPPATKLLGTQRVTTRPRRWYGRRVVTASEVLVSCGDLAYNQWYDEASRGAKPSLRQRDVHRSLVLGEPDVVQTHRVGDLVDRVTREERTLAHEDERLFGAGVRWHLGGVVLGRAKWDLFGRDVLSCPTVDVPC